MTADSSTVPDTMRAAVLRDYDSQRADGVAEPAFVARGNPLLPGDPGGDVWTAERATARVAALDEE